MKSASSSRSGVLHNLLPPVLGLILICAFPGPMRAQPYQFTHFAGTVGGAGYEDGTGSVARFADPRAVAVDGAGNVYVADTANHTIRKITSGVVTTVAGLAGERGNSDGSGSAARFNSPSGIAVDGAGTLYVADFGNCTIRKITSGGVVTTLAGLAGSPGTADGTGSAARFTFPMGVAVGTAGDVYVADTNSHTIRAITSGGFVTTLAGLAGSPGSADGTGSSARFNVPTGVAVDASGTVYVADNDNHTIRAIASGGVVTTLAGLPGNAGTADGTGNAARFANSQGVAVDGTGTVFVADSNGHTIRKVTSGGVVTTLAGLGYAPGSIDGTGSAARFNYPTGVAVDASGNVYVADFHNSAIRAVTSGGVVTTLAGLAASSGSNDDTGNAARFNYPSGISVDSGGTVYVADSYNHTIRKITTAGVVTTLAGLAGSQGTADGTGSDARFASPMGVAVDTAGNVYGADLNSHTIRAITSGGVVTTLAGLGDTPGCIDGTGSAARFNYPTGVAVGSDGTVYVADSNCHTIRKITGGGVVTTLAGVGYAPGSIDGTGSAARFNYPSGIAVDTTGNVYVADRNNQTIRKVTTGGVVTTLAGLAGYVGGDDGTGSAARLNSPRGIAVDGSGTVYVADTNNKTIRKITSEGVVTTLAGAVDAPGSSDGIGIAARFYDPLGIAVDGSGKLYVGDSTNNAIRVGSLPPIPDAATIDSPGGAVDATRQLDASPVTATSWQWSIIRRPAGSTAELSSTSIRNPTFTPDVADLYVFRLVATDAGGAQSITQTSLLTYTPATATVSGGGTICAGMTATIQADLTGTPPWSLTWSDGASPTGITSSPFVRQVSPAITTNYTVTTVSDANGPGTPSGSALVTVSGIAPSSFISVPYVVSPGQSGVVASVPDAGGGATYAWVPTNATITAGAGTRSITFTAGVSGQSTLQVTVTAGTCWSTSTRAITIMQPVSEPLAFRTLAGNPGGSEDGPKTQARFSYPYGVAVDGVGNVYVGDQFNHRIRKVAPDGTVTTLAGAGTVSADDGKGAAAMFQRPAGVAIDGSGNVYVADSWTHRIRKIALDRTVTSLAGQLSPGFLDGPAATAQFNNPTGVALDSTGNVYVADSSNNRIRKIATDGNVSTIAGNGTYGFADGSALSAQFRNPTGVAVDVAGNIYVADCNNNRIRKISAGVVSTLSGDGTFGYADGPGASARFASPKSVAVDGSGNVFVGDESNSRIRVIAPDGTTTTRAGSGAWGYADGTGPAAKFRSPIGVAVDTSGNVIVADSFNNRIRSVAPDGTVSTLAGSSTSSFGFADGPGMNALMGFPMALTVNPSTGEVYFPDQVFNRIRKVAPDGSVSTLAGNGSGGYVDGPGPLAQFNRPMGIAWRGAELIVADAGNNRIRRVALDGSVSTIAGDGTPGYLDGPGGSARFADPVVVAVDGAGNVYVGETGNLRIRKIALDGTVTTLAGSGSMGYVDGPGATAQFHDPNGLAVDGLGNVYVCDTWNSAVRKVAPDGTVSTFAGGNWGFADGPGLTAKFRAPYGLSIDALSNIYVADQWNHRIRRVAQDGTVTTVGGGIGGGIDGTGVSAQFTMPAGVAVGGDGALYVMDTDNNAVRVGRAATVLDFATIDQPAGAVGVPRQLDVMLEETSSWQWSVIRQPSGSNAQLSSTTMRNPTFTPDVADLYVFRVIATGVGGSSTTTVSLNVVPTPTISNVNPNNGPIAGAQSVVITGTNLVGATVTFGGVAATVTNTTETTATVTTPAHVPGAVDVTVTTLGGSATSSGGYTYVAVPTITAINPPTGPIEGGQSVVLTGTNLNGATVIIGGTAAAMTDTTATTATFTTPAHAQGPVDVTVTTTGGSATSTGGYFYVHCLASPPTIDAPPSVCSVLYQYYASVPDAGAGAAYTWWITGGTISSGQGTRTVRFSPTSTATSMQLSIMTETPSACSFAMTTILVNVTPPARFTLTPTDVCVGVTETATVTSADPGPGTIYEWNVINGTITSGAGTRNMTFIRGNAGSVKVTLFVTSPGGCTRSWSRSYLELDDTYFGSGLTSNYALVGVAVSDRLFPSAGGSGSAIATPLGGCALSAVSSAPWLAITGQTPLADGSVQINFNVAPNTTSVTRACTLNVSGVEVSISQRGVAVSDSHSIALKTIAGRSSSSGYADGTGAAVRFSTPFGVVFDTMGNAYIADNRNHVIRKMDTAGNVTTFAGEAGNAGYRDGPASQARFNNPEYLAIDSSGNLYVTESEGAVTSISNSTIRKITPAGDVSTFAGRPGVAGYANGPRLSAVFNHPAGLAFDPSGNLYVVDMYNLVIRKITPAGDVSLFAGSGLQSIDSGVLDGPATVASFDQPEGLACDGSGNLYVADLGTNTIRKITPAGDVTTIAGGTDVPGNVDGIGQAARFGSVLWDIAVAPDGNLYVPDQSNKTIRRVTPAGVVTTIAGGNFIVADGIGTAAGFQSPNCLGIRSDGTILVADGDRLRWVTPTGIVTTGPGPEIFDPTTPVDGNGANAVIGSSALAIGADGNAYFAAGTSIRKVTPSGLVTTIAGTYGTAGMTDGPVASALFTNATTITSDALGTLYVGDNGTIRMIAGGNVTTIAGQAGVFQSKDGTGSAAWFADITALASDAAGNLYIGDSTSVRKMTPGRVVTTVAGTAGKSGYLDGPGASALFDGIEGLAAGSSGEVFVSDTFGRIIVKNDAIRKIAADGTVSTVAGSPRLYGLADGFASASRTMSVGQLALDSDGNVLMPDSRAGTIRKLTPAGEMTTIAGIGEFVGHVDGRGSAARLLSPLGIAVDSTGRIWVSDGGLIRISVPAPSITNMVPNGGSTAGGQSVVISGANFEGASVRIGGDFAPITSATSTSITFTTLPHPAGAADVTVTTPGGTATATYTYSCVAVSIPTPVSPADDATAIALSTPLVWNLNAGDFRYDILLDESPTPSRTIAMGLAANIVDGANLFIAGNLRPGTTYYWQILARGDPSCAGSGQASSQVRSFTTVGSCDAPSAFSLNWPADGTSGVGSAIRISWEAAAGASLYDVYLGPTNPPQFFDSKSDTFIDISGLVPGTTYYWSVVAHSTCDAARTTATPLRSFTTTGVCAAPGGFALDMPANGAVLVSTDPTLAWTTSANASSYEIYLGTSSEPPLLLTGYANQSFSIRGLVAGAKYYWKVVARAGCNNSLTAVSSIANFTTASACNAPSLTLFTAIPQGNIGVGQTYSLAWSASSGLDPGGEYLIERATDSAFTANLLSQRTRETSAMFVVDAASTYYHRVRAIQGCNAAQMSPWSPSAQVTGEAEGPMVVFTVQPEAVLTTIGEDLSTKTSHFVLENLSSTAVTVIVGKQEIKSEPFFTIVDPDGASGPVTLEPRTPKEMEIQFGGVSATTSASYHGVIFLTSTGTALKVTPYASVDLRVGAEASTATPQFIVDGVAAEYVAFDPWAGDDADRPARTISIRNSGATAMDLGGEIGPEVWLVPEAGWNATPIPAGSDRTVKLYTQRNRAPAGSGLPRYTYFTVRTIGGKTARLLVQDNDDLTIVSGRETALESGARSIIVPDVLSQVASGGMPLATQLRITNLGTDAAQADLYFTPSGADGFSASVKRTTVVIQPNAVVTLTDPLLQMFGATRPARGQIEIRAAEDRLASLLVQAGLMSMTGDRLLIARSEVLPRGYGVTYEAPHRIPGITKSTTLTTALILAETSGYDNATVLVRLYDAAGVVKGEKSYTVQRYSHVREADVVAALGGGTSLAVGQVVISWTSGGGIVAAISEVIDAQGKSRATTIGAGEEESAGEAMRTDGSKPMATVATVFVVPIVVSGQVDPSSGSSYHVGMSFAAGSVATTGVVNFTTTGGTSYQESLTLAANQTVSYENILSQLFGITGSARGSITASFDEPLAVSSRVYGVTTVSAVPVIAASDVTMSTSSSTPLFVDGLEQSVSSSCGTRWNVYVTESAGVSGSVTVRVYESGDRSIPLEQQTFTVPANGQRKLETIFAELGLDSALRKKDRTDVLCNVTPSGGGARLSAVAVGIDNATGDVQIRTLQKGTGLPSTLRTVVPGEFPQISSFTPASGLVGAEVTINGKALTDTWAVYFNTTPATSKTIVSDSKVTALVPVGATSGRITVRTGSGTTSSASSFTVQSGNPVPTITGLTPSTGVVGASVEISGNALTGATAVKFNGVSAAFTFVSDSEITAAVPTGATTGKVTVTTPGGTATSATNFTVILAPTISSFTPLSGGVGESVTLTGAGFTGATAVKFNGISANYSGVTDTQLTAAVPVGATSGKITVTTAAGTATSANDFTVIAKPSISSFAPTSGLAGSSVTITGSAFTGATSVKFNGTTATFTVTSATQITATVPAAATTGTISVTTPGGTATSTSSYTVITAPSVTIFSPPSGPVGTDVTIRGKGFTGVTSVKFNGTSSAFVIDSDEEVTATVPNGATTGTISVTTPGGTATSATSFTVTVIHPAPTISAFSPTKGIAGTSVTITGAGFTGTSSVKFNGVAAQFTFVSDTQLTAYVPSGATSGKISVTTAAGTGTSAGLFTVIQKPTITSFTPAHAASGAQVTISGTSFTYVTVVKFNGVTATFTVGSDTQITATVPATATTGRITVTNPAGTATSATSFRVDGTAVITSFTPFHGGSGTSVTITGTDIVGATSVTFGGVAATFVVISNTQISATVPAAAVTGKIGVTTSKGSVVSDEDFVVHGVLATGDSNADGVIDGSDIVYLINALFGSGRESMASADVNGDGAANVTDVFYLINYVFMGGPGPV